MTDGEWGYLAGLIDGESHLGISGPSVRITISNSSVAMMNWLESHMPVGKKHNAWGASRQLDGSTKRSERPMWAWWIGNEDIRCIVLSVMPYLTAKREEKVY